MIKGTKLFDIWKSGNYQPLDSNQATKLIAHMKEYVPRWVRIQRIQRDVPAQKIISGVKKSNLRQIVEKEMKNHNKTCQCIRCREIGHKSLETPIDFSSLDVGLSRINYEASCSLEIFLSIEDRKQDLIIGYLRLRDVALSHRYELNNESCMIIRELKILGMELAIGQKTKSAIQHRGFGRQLVNEAEKICFEEFDKKKLYVLSGIGVKQYYRNLGFSDDGVYLSKGFYS